MTLKYIVLMKATHFFNQKDPPFDMKHQRMSADPPLVVKNDFNIKSNSTITDFKTFL